MISALIVVSCAYFKKEEDSLQQAQIQKLDHTLKKLDLKQGEKLLDVGCGWGYLSIYLARLVSFAHKSKQFLNHWGFSD
ncbi:hypothetical protein HSHS1_09220 [Helicobacter suis HS1]|nr:hypothetical protein HSHS1_09220 [Helicobacter suis HS1]